MSDAKTLRVYDARAAEYDALVRPEKADTALTAFVAALPGGARVLDLGCGPGRAAAQMAEAGLHVEAVDASAEMVALAGRHAGVTARQATFDQIEGHEIYDGIWANFCLLHAARADLPRHLAALAQALKPGGLFHIGMKLGTGEARDRIGRFYTYVGETELLDMLRTAGLTPKSAGFGRDTGLDGTSADWITVAAKARADG